MIGILIHLQRGEGKLLAFPMQGSVSGSYLAGMYSSLAYCPWNLELIGFAISFKCSMSLIVCAIWNQLHPEGMLTQALRFRCREQSPVA
ncbi:hypothetical protein D3C73_1496820 [compost metagenome]